MNIYLSYAQNKIQLIVNQQISTVIIPTYLFYLTRFILTM